MNTPRNLHSAGLTLALFSFISPLRADESKALPAPWKHQDIGSAQRPGTAAHADGVFTLAGTMDIWGPADGCQIAWQQVHGDIEIAACVTSFDNPGGIAHAKAGLSLRESLDPGSRHVTLCVTSSDGVQFLYRDTANGLTTRIFGDAQSAGVAKGEFPCWIKLVRRGDEISGFESMDGQKWTPSGQIKLHLAFDAVVGLTASSHKPNILAKATFDHVSVAAPAAPTAAAAPKRISQLATLGIDGSELHVIYQSKDRIEAPNWSPDGKWLVYNSKGRLLKISVAGKSVPEQIPSGEVKNINNDHVISPEGGTIFFSAGGHLYSMPFEGGEPRRFSNDQAPERKFNYYLHGLSPDGKTIAYAGTEKVGDNPVGRINLYTIPAAGGADVRLTNGTAPDDGPEYSSDGKWIYFNSELHAKVPGHSQCYRMKPDGGDIEQLTHDERVNWFPHISPDMNWIVFISFPAGTEKHPANRDVILRRMKPDGSEQADIMSFNGGQGTINVNSWSPVSKHFAFVMYPEAAK